MAKNKKEKIPTPDQVDSNELPSQVERAMDLYIEGYTEVQIGRTLKKEYSLGASSIKKYLKEAREAFSIPDTKSREYYHNLYLARYDELYRLAKEKGHYGVCVSILDNQSKINKLYEPKEGDNYKVNIIYNKLPKAKE